MTRKKPEPTIRRLSEKGPLHDLLLRACPPDEKGVKSIPVLARKLKISPWAVYRWIDNEHMNPNRVQEVLKVAPKSEGLTLDDFYPYIFTEN